MLGFVGEEERENSGETREFTLPRVTARDETVATSNNISSSYGSSSNMFHAVA